MGEAMVVRLADGTSTEVDDVTELDWSSSPFLVLRTEQMVSCLFQADQVRSVTPRPPDDSVDSAVVPVAALPWAPSKGSHPWCVIDATGRTGSRWGTEAAARGQAGVVGGTVAREETATLTRLVPVE